MFISIVIPTYNALELIKSLLSTIERQTAPKDRFEVIIIDDGSTDDTFAFLEKYKITTELNFKCEKINNHGPAYARNYGAELASTEWIGFIDADVEVDANWVTHAIAKIQATPGVGAIEGRTEISKKGNITFFTHQTENTKGEKYVTCNLIVQKKLVSFYSKYSSPFREDSDLAFQIITKGYQIDFDSRIVVYHPPLKGNWKKPIKLSKRYYSDGLLARRFPKLYRKNVDCHEFLGMQIPHSRRKLMIIHIVSIVTAIFLLVSGKYISFLSIYLISLYTAFAPAIYIVPIQNWKIKDVLKYMIIAHITPWVLLYHYYKGIYKFRNEPEFQSNP